MGDSGTPAARGGGLTSPGGVKGTPRCHLSIAGLRRGRVSKQEALHAGCRPKRRSLTSRWLFLDTKRSSSLLWPSPAFLLPLWDNGPVLQLSAAIVFITLTHLISRSLLFISVICRVAAASKLRIGHFLRSNFTLK